MSSAAKPVTIEPMRAGPDKARSILYDEIAKQDALAVSAMTMHGRRSAREKADYLRAIFDKIYPK